MADRLTIVVHGHPQPAGSKRGFPIKRAGEYTGRVAITDDNPKSREWKSSVSSEAVLALTGTDMELWSGPLGFAATFTLARPKSHFGTGRNAGQVRDAAPAHPITKPDTTKLVRAVEDALTGILWRDDAQVVEQVATKVYGAPEGVRITVWRL